MYLTKYKWSIFFDQEIHVKCMIGGNSHLKTNPCANFKNTMYVLEDVSEVQRFIEGQKHHGLVLSQMINLWLVGAGIFKSYINAFMKFNYMVELLC